MELIDTLATEPGLEVLYNFLLLRAVDKDDFTPVSARAIGPWEEWKKEASRLRHEFKALYVVKTTEGHIGFVGLRYTGRCPVVILAPFRGKGYGTEALSMLMKRHPMDRYVAHIHDNNEPSKALYGKLGFSPTNYRIYEKYN